MTPRQSVLDAALDVLSNAFRRRLLLALLDREPKAPVKPVNFDSETRPPGRWSAHATHVHLPKLEDAGFVAWDHDSGEVRRGPTFEEIEPLLALFDDHATELPFQWP